MPSQQRCHPRKAPHSLPASDHGRDGVTSGDGAHRSRAAKGRRRPDEEEDEEDEEEEEEEEEDDDDDRSPTLPGLSLRPSLLSTRRSGPTTPTASWKLLPNPSPSPAAPIHSLFSVRKLALTLWELQEFPAFKASRFTGATPLSPAITSPCSQRVRRRTVSQNQPSEGVWRHTQCNGQTVWLHSRLNQFSEKQMIARTQQMPASSMNEIESDHKVVAPPNSVVYGKGASGGSGFGPTSSGFLNVLKRLWNLEEQYASSMSLVSTLRVDLDHAHAQVKQLMHEQKLHRKEIDSLTKRLEDERVMWQERGQEAVRIAVHSINLEVEKEKKSKRRLEILHKKLIRDLIDLKCTLCRSLQDLETERKAREFVEDIYDDLARGIGKDKDEVEELKRASAKVREELEEERKMLQMAEIWREERVQMKLAEARLELEEKNTAVDKLRSDLEAFFKSKRACDSRKEETQLIDKDLERHRSSSHYVHEARIGTWNSVGSGYLHEVRIPGRNLIESGYPSQARDTAYEIQGHDSDDLRDDCLHSIELYSDSFQGTTSTTNLSHLQKVAGDNSRKSTERRDPSIDLIDAGKNPRSLNIPGHEKTRSNSGITAIESKEKAQQWDYATDSQWIDRTIERGEMREWSCGKFASAVNNESNISWQSDLEVSQSHMTISATNLQGSTDTLVQNGSFTEEIASLRAEADATPDSYRSNAASRVAKSLGNVKNPHTSKGIIPMQQHVNVASSPRHQWNHYWSSSDPGSSHHSGTSIGSADMPKVARDNSLKSKLLEARPEFEKTRFRAAKHL